MHVIGPECDKPVPDLEFRYHATPCSSPDPSLSLTCSILLNNITNMLAASTRSALSRANISRSFATSARLAQATPVEKPVLEKEFKIYRWVRIFLPWMNLTSLCSRELVRTRMSRQRSRHCSRIRLT
jgi:hypothetical protein